MSNGKRIAITAGGLAAFVAVALLTATDTWDWSYIPWRLDRWKGGWEDWTSLVIFAGVTIGIALIIWSWTDGDPTL